MMRFYTQQHPYYCGIDLHTRKMYVCILDQAAHVLVHRNIQIYGKSWVVYSKRPFSGPQRVLDYLGRYTHRVAIS